MGEDKTGANISLCTVLDTVHYTCSYRETSIDPFPNPAVLDFLY